MRKFRIAIAVLVAFLLGLFVSVSWGEGDSQWKLVGKYSIPKNDGALKVVCDAERGNFVYLAPVSWGEKVLGNTIAVVHQPDDCGPDQK